MSNRKLAIILGISTGIVLVGMAILAVATGASQDRLEHVMAPEPYAIALLNHASSLRALMALDVAFLILYTAFFAALALHLRGRPFVHLALGLMVAVAVLDIIEDHHIIAMLEAAEHRVLPSASAIAFQSAESATKFSISFLSLMLFGLAIPRTTKLGIVLAVFLTVGTLLSAILGYAVPPAYHADIEACRMFSFLAGFGLATAWLIKEPEPAS